MRRAGLLAILALLVVPLTAAAQEKWVRGEITAVAGNSITVKTADGSMTFMVDASTDIFVRGGATATREAQRLGKPGATLDKLFSVGEAIEIHYHDMGGKMHASELLGISAVATEPSEAKKGSSARGTVTAVSASSITVKGAGGEWTFAVDAKTVIEGTGMGTAARELAKKGEPVMITKLVGQNDEVTVQFTDKHADHVRVIRKAVK